MKLYQAYGFCSICKKMIEGAQCSEFEETIEYMQSDHFSEFRHFVDGDTSISEVKKPSVIFSPREPQSNGSIKPVKQKKWEKYK